MLAIGLMSGTSLDGIDCSLIETDGQYLFKPQENFYFPYPIEFQIQLKKLFANYENWLSIEKVLTDYHANCVHTLLTKANVDISNIDVIGFHGQTIYHNPDQGLTWQIGNPHQLAALTGIKVVSDFRRRDMAYKGQGAPLIPVFHQAITAGSNFPIAVINIGGVSNITYIDENELIAFDTGPGNALINDMMSDYYQKPYDSEGAVATAGIVHGDIVAQLMRNIFFTLMPPKSLDRNEFIEYKDLVHSLSALDTIATLTNFTVTSIMHSLKFLPMLPKIIYICGGGVKNRAIMAWLKQECAKSFVDLQIMSIKELGLDPDFIESQGFAYLAVRYLNGLCSTFSTTTRTSKAAVAGVLF